MDQLLREFLEDAEKLIDKLAGDLEALRSRRDEGRIRRESLARIFRGVHTLKGSASAFELASITKTAHEFETLIERVRLGHSTLDESVLDAFEDAASALAQMLRAVSEGEHPGTQSLLGARLRSLRGVDEIAATESAASAGVIAALPDEVARTLSKNEKHQLEEALLEGARAYCVEVNFDVATFDKNFKELSEALIARGEIISTQPGVPGAATDQINFRLIYATQMKPEEFKPKLGDFGSIKLTEVTSDGLNELKAVNGNNSSSGQPDRITSSIELPSVPLDNTIARAIRAGVVAAHEAGKEIHFEVKGGDLKVNKSLLDSIGECLLHLVRNAVDHGIETPAERLAAGKSGGGQIMIFAKSSENRISLRITDDGCGIDPRRVEQVAIERGIIDARGAISEEECIRIIFTPGFSTAESVSTVSGRGVGLDVVDQAARQIGGEIRVQSEVGVGTTFELQWPMNSA